MPISTTSSLPRTLVAALSMMALWSCAAEPGSDPAASVTQLAQRIQTLVGDAACEDNSQCRSIAIGAKACGGPDSYLAWSTLRTDETQLKEAVARHAARRQAENRANRLVSNCMMVTDPGASCRARRCSLNPTGLGPGASRTD